MSENLLPESLIQRAMRCSYAQSVLSSIYAASTGGMFIIGYALALGADNHQIGVMSGLPMVFIVVQFISAAVIERGMSRRRLAIAGSLLNVSGWILIVSIPGLPHAVSSDTKIGLLIGILALNSLFAYAANNARASWVGDLIPADRRGSFFGRMIMFGGIIGAVFAIVEGMFLDYVKHLGIAGFTWLFLFGMVFGLVNVLLFLPQSDIPVVKDADGVSLRKMLRQTFGNLPLLILMAYTVVWSMQMIAGPYYATYIIRDLKMRFLDFGLLNGVAIVTTLISSAWWGRIIDRYGSRPVLVACTLALIPVPLAWLWIDSPRYIYQIIVPVNLLVGFASGGVAVALNTLIFKLVPVVGRSVQLAVHSVVVMLMAAPMPILGAHLPDWLEMAGVKADLRVTFLATIPILMLATVMAWKLVEPDSVSTRHMVRSLVQNSRDPSS